MLSLHAVDYSLGWFWSELIGRLSGPMSFRFVLQPVMAMLFACRDGLHDARAGRPPYAWTILTHRDDRWPLLREGARAVLRVIVLGIIMDAAYQFLVLRAVRPVELVVVVLALAFVPYLIVRGLANRLVRQWRPAKDARP